MRLEVNRIMKVAIIDYQLGNLFSVKNALNQVGLDAEITSSPDDMLVADALVLPGVGAFHVAMKNLRNLNLINPIHQFINTGKPFIGICLGFQLLFSNSNEFE